MRACDCFCLQQKVAEPNPSEDQRKHPSIGRVFSLVPRAGFEPATLGLEVLCSIQLSYRGMMICLTETPLAAGYLDRADCAY